MRHFQHLSANVRGILCLVIALVFLTFSDSIVKWLSPRYALHEIMLFRALFALSAVLVIVRLEGGLHLLKTRRPALHFFRGLLLVIANMFFFLGLSTLPLAETVALFFTAPLFICILSQPVLGERVSAACWGAIAIGLVGVLVMLRPGFGIFNPAGLLPVGAALAYAVMQMVTRKLGMRDKAGTLTFYIQAAFIVVSTAVGLGIGDGRFSGSGNDTLEFLLRAWYWPERTDLLLMVACGLIVAFGGYFMSQAYRLGQASVVAPFEYTSMPLALAVGFYVWGDWPDLVAFAGAGLVMAGGLLVLYHEGRAPRAVYSRTPRGQH